MLQIISNSLQLVQEIDQIRGDGVESGFSLMFKVFMCQLELSGGDFQSAIDTCNTVIEKILQYYENKEVNDLIVDPLIILSSIYMQIDNIDQAEENIVKAERITREQSGLKNEKIIEVWTIAAQIMLQKQKYKEAIEFSGLKLAACESVYGPLSPQYAETLEEQVALTSSLGLVQFATPLIEKLIRLQIDLNDGENNEKMITVYELAQGVYMKSRNFLEVIKITQKQLDIYRQLFPSKKYTSQEAMYEVRLAYVQCVGQGKFTEGLNLFKETEQKLTKIAPSDPNATGLLQELNSLRQQCLQVQTKALEKQQEEQKQNKEKSQKEGQAKAEESKEGSSQKKVEAKANDESILDIIKPNTPVKAAAWGIGITAAVMAGVVFMRKR